MTLEETIQFINDPSLQMEDEVWKQHPIYTKYSSSNFGRIKYLDRFGKEVIKRQWKEKHQKRCKMSLMIGDKQKTIGLRVLFVNAFMGCMTIYKLTISIQSHMIIV